MGLDNGQRGGGSALPSPRGAPKVVAPVKVRLPKALSTPRDRHAEQWAPPAEPAEPPIDETGEGFFPGAEPTEGPVAVDDGTPRNSPSPPLMENSEAWANYTSNKGNVPAYASFEGAKKGADEPTTR